MDKAPKILLVEDNPDDELLTIAALEMSNLVNEIQVCRDGLEALDYLYCRGKYADRDKSDLPALILLDINMPKVSGLDVLRELRSQDSTKRTPVVMLTTSQEDSDLVESYDLGANSYVKKPVDFEEFSQAVSRLGFYWLLLNKPAP
ncbi:MAG: response regulator [Pseudomonadales bacterium]|nr:response regulator [Pseudomonadales bacterium]